MTAAQKLWLDAHPDYHVMGRPGGLARYKNTGVLFPDGSFVQGAKAASTQEAFRVGQREVAEPGQVATPR